MSRFTAEWILPISDDPIRGGCVTVEGGRITAVSGVASGPAVELGRAVVLPGLVNAHTHLELSHLHGRIPPAATFLEWIRPLLAARREPAEPALVQSAARSAIQHARACGTALVGDVGNTLLTVPLLRDGRLPAHVFCEVIAFRAKDADERVAAARAALDAAGVAGGQRLSLAPHAPYSVSPELFRAIRRDLDTHPPAVSSVHLAESLEETELLKSGTGPWRDLLEEMDVWDPAWDVPECSPAAYLDRLGFLDRSVLAVHCVQCDGADLARLRARGVTIVSCPRSNRHVGVGSPPLEAFYAMDVDVAFGTDSLASVRDLDMFAELAEARRIAPRVPARTLLRSATLSGARALGFGEEYGSIEPGKRAALLAVRVPGGVEDVEEYLLSGRLEPGDLTWLTDPSGPADATAAS